MVIDDDLHDGHAPGAPVSCVAAERIVDSLYESNVLTNPPVLCFGEGWRPGWPQGSGKRNDYQYKRHRTAAQFRTDADASHSPCGLPRDRACCRRHAFLSTGSRPVPATALIKARSNAGRSCATRNCHIGLFPGALMRLLDRSQQSVPRPATCPFCHSRAVGTLAKVIDTDTYWRCSQCGSGWTAPHPGEQPIRGTR